MGDFLDEKRKEIDERLRELRPLVDEFHRLEKASAALAGAVEAPRTRRPAKARKRAAAGGARGRPKGSGKRALQAQELVSARPGITIAELADEMGIQSNYLYRVMPILLGEGKVRREGNGWHPA